MGDCIICNRDDRAEIENAILNIAPGRSVDDIAKQYKVDLSVLKMHALFHTPLVSLEDLDLGAKISTWSPVNGTSASETPKAEVKRDSLTRQMKLREADMLEAVSNEYLVTLKTMGRRINKMAQVSSIDEEDADKQIQLAKLLTKPMVDLYVGVGSEIRQTVRTLAELNHMLNGPEDETATGLKALANAISGSSHD